MDLQEGLMFHGLKQLGLISLLAGNVGIMLLAALSCQYGISGKLLLRFVFIFGCLFDRKGGDVRPRAIGYMLRCLVTKCAVSLKQ